jgi:hypothetical protein
MAQRIIESERLLYLAHIHKAMVGALYLSSWFGGTGRLTVRGVNIVSLFHQKRHTTAIFHNPRDHSGDA